MATKKTPVNPDDMFASPDNAGELDQAIDDLRGVLKADESGDLSEFGGSDFGSAGSSPMDLDAEFGGSATAAEPAFGGADFGGSDFGGSELGGSDFGGGLGSDFGGSDFGSAGASSDHAMPEPGSALDSNLDLIMDIPITVEIVLGTSKMQVAGLMGLEEGAIIALDKRIGEPVEITVNGRRIAKGEITVLENDDTRFGVKLTEVLSTKKI